MRTIIKSAVLALLAALSIATACAQPSPISGPTATPSGTAGGDLCSLYPNPTICKISGAIPSLVFGSTYPVLVNPLIGSGAPAYVAINQQGTASNLTMPELALQLYQYSNVGKSSTVTVTTANPAVFTLNGHGAVAGAPVVPKTTGSFGTGITPNQTYYVSTVGLTSNNFTVADTAAHAIAGTNTIALSGSQSGTHSLNTADNAFKEVASFVAIGGPNSADNYGFGIVAGGYAGPGGVRVNGLEIDLEGLGATVGSYPSSTDAIGGQVISAGSFKSTAAWIAATATAGLLNGFLAAGTIDYAHVAMGTHINAFDSTAATVSGCQYKGTGFCVSPTGALTFTSASFSGNIIPPDVAINIGDATHRVGTGYFFNAVFSNGITVGASAGVACSGSPSSSFASIAGIVTHC